VACLRRLHYNNPLVRAHRRLILVPLTRISQGESLHRLMKRMYAVTNKREHAGQIATKVMRLARGRALIESMANKVDRKLQLTKSADNGMRKRRLRLMQRRQSQSYEDPFGLTPTDVHHCISNIRRRPIPLAYFNPQKGDPAMTVCSFDVLLCLWISLSEDHLCRTSSQSSRIISSAAFSTGNLTVIHTMNFQQTIAIPFESWTIKYTKQRFSASTIPPTTSGVIKMFSILVLRPLLWSAPRKPSPVHTHTGMLRF
jgi:hypothetical protein